MGQWVIVSDFGDGYRIYQACELVIVLLLPSWWAGGSGLWVFSRPFLFLFCISSLSNSYFCHQFFYFLYFFYFTFVFLPPISYSYSAPPPPSLAPSGLMPHLSLLPPERHLMLVLHHRPLMAAVQIQYSAQVTRPQSSNSLVTGSMIWQTWVKFWQLGGGSSSSRPSLFD